jgi:alpha-glucosidase (family GH31 glycosyl hydrolase)
MRRPSPRLPVILALHAALAGCGSSHGSSDTASTVELSTGELTIRVAKDPFAISVADRRGDLLAEAPDADRGSLVYWRGDSEHHVVRATASPVRRGDRISFAVETSEGPGADAEVVVEMRDDGAFVVELAPPSPATVTAAGDRFVAGAGERYYGLTERIISDGPLGAASELAPQEVGSLDRRGELVRISVAPTISIYTPFLHSSRGYGLFVDGPMEGDFDLGKTETDRLAIRFNVDPGAQRFRYHVLHGPGHAAILDHYTALTGRPWLPPRWAYQHMRWRDEHASGATAPLDGVEMNAALVEDVTMYQDLGFPPPGWYAFDRPWSSGPAGACPGAGFTRFEFDPLRFPNAAQMIAALAARGTRTLVWGSPWACGDPQDPLDNAFDAARQGYLAPNDRIHLDFTNPAATAWWQDRVGNFVDTMHIAGFKLDRGDETVPSKATDVYFDGRNGLALHNDYPRLYVQAYAEVLQAVRPGDWVTMTRPGWAGSQAYGLYWGGDITGANTLGNGAGTDKGLRSALISLQRMAFMGFPNWGTDTGGYYQFKQRDVFARWLELSAFCPIMEIGGALRLGNGTDGPHAPWAMPTEPHYDDEMIDIYRYYTWLHHELVPYAYSEGVRASRTGHPIATPLVFEYPDDATVGNMWDEYLYGPWLLVAPVWRDGDRSRFVYLPNDEWTDFWDDRQVLHGPLSQPTVSAPLDRIPLYIRLGAIIPMDVANSVTGFGNQASAGRLTLAIYPHQTSRYELHEQDGRAIVITSDKRGAYDESAAIRISTSSATQDYLLRVRANFNPSRVVLNGAALEPCGDQAELDNPDGSCAWLAADGRVLVKYSTANQAATVNISP